MSDFLVKIFKSINHIIIHKDFDIFQNLYEFRSKYFNTSSSETQRFRHILWCHITSINSTLIFFRGFTFFAFYIWQKSVLIRLKIKTICLTEKAFWMIIKIIKKKKKGQELIYYIHCFGWYFFIKARPREIFLIS